MFAGAANVAGIAAVLVAKASPELVNASIVHDTTFLGDADVSRHLLNMSRNLYSQHCDLSKRRAGDLHLLRLPQ